MEPVQFGVHAPAQRVIVHLSDTHLLAGGAALDGRIDVTANLRLALEAVERTGIRPDAIVFTGDLADVGDAAAYRAIVVLGAQEMRAGGRHLPLAAGMQLTAEIVQDQRTVMEYLLSPVRRVAAEAGRER